MTTVYLIRHAEAEGNLYRRFQGWHDGLITEKGTQQIEALAARFADIPIDAVYSSDLRRTMTTAGAIYRPKRLELHVEPQLREIGGGIWEDKTWGELMYTRQEELLRFFACDLTWQVEGGETYQEVQRRVVAAIRRIAAAHEGQTVAIVAHGTAIVCAMAFFLGRSLSQVPHGDNTCVAKLLIDGERVEVEYFNDISHLTPELLPRKLGPFRQEEFVKRNLWFRPLDLEREEELYRQARGEAWQTSHGTMEGFDGERFLQTARANSAADPTGVLVAMRGDSPAGILQMDDDVAAEEGAGFIWFLYLEPDARGSGLGGQLLGQAVSRYRAMGRESIRLRCAPENAAGERFYKRHGFSHVGQVPGGLNNLDLLEKKIVPCEA